MTLVLKFLVHYIDYNEEFKDSSDRPHPLESPKEKYFWGLLKGREFSQHNVTIRRVEGRGRSAFAAKSFQPGDFVCGVVHKKKKTKDDREMPSWV